MASVRAPDDALTSYDYDEVGNLTSRTDANDHATTMGYDDEGRLTSETAPQTNTFSAPLTLDPSGPEPSVTLPIVAGKDGPLQASLDWNAPITRSASPVGKLEPDSSAEHPITADGRTITHADLSWAKGHHAVTDTTTHDVPAPGSSVTKTITPDATGDISAQIDWDKITKSKTIEDSAPNAPGQDDNTLVVNANGTISLTLTWAAQVPNDLDLYLFEGTTELDRSDQLTGNSETLTYDVTGLSHPDTRTFTQTPADFRPFVLPLAHQLRGAQGRRSEQLKGSRQFACELGCSDSSHLNQLVRFGSEPRRAHGVYG